MIDQDSSEEESFRLIPWEEVHEGADGELPLLYYYIDSVSVDLTILGLQ